MALLVVAYPELAAADLAWIEAIRAEHDPHATVIRAHLTLVFPLTGLPEATLVARVRDVAARTTAFAVELGAASVVKDVLGGQTHVFLVPDGGNGDLIRLHDRLYAGPLAPYLRLDVPFIPHLTVKAAPDPAACKALADDLNERGFLVRGAVSALDVVRYEGGRVATVARVPLGPGDPAGPSAA